MRRLSLRILVFMLGVLFFPDSIVGEELPSLEDLPKLNIVLYDLPTVQARARKLFPLSDPRVSRLLSDGLAKGLSPHQGNGLSVVLYAHGAQGFLWALSQLATNDSPRLRIDLCWALFYHNYREAYVFYISLLDDKRPSPVSREEALARLGPPREPDLGPPLPYEGPLRVCDFAFIVLRPKLSLHKFLPEKQKELLGQMSAGVPIFQRGQKIALLKDWWAKEGERLVTAKCPSVVEVLLKEAEARSKQQEKARQSEQKAPGEKPAEPRPNPAPSQVHKGIPGTQYTNCVMRRPRQVGRRDFARCPKYLIGVSAP